VSIETSIAVEGAEEFRAAIEKLDSAIQRHVHLRLTEWAANVEDLAKQLVPVKTGYLRSTIHARVQEWNADIDAEASYASVVEFGTRAMQARPYLYPAVMQHLPRLEQIFLEAIDAAKTEAAT
jgi:HK97 gp10 family phage protein